MNPRRVHELMEKHFPFVDAAGKDWAVAADSQGLRADVIERLLIQHIPSGDLLVRVSRKIGDLLPRESAINLIRAHIGQAEIRISNREFSGFVVVSLSGVATGWRPIS